MNRYPGTNNDSHIVLYQPNETVSIEVKLDGKPPIQRKVALSLLVHITRAKQAYQENIACAARLMAKADALEKECEQ